jgi:hypothetical protein
MILWRLVTNFPSRPRMPGTGHSYYATKGQATKSMDLWKRTRPEVYRMVLVKCTYDARTKLELALDAANIDPKDVEIVQEWKRG